MSIHISYIHTTIFLVAFIKTVVGSITLLVSLNTLPRVARELIQTTCVVTILE